VRALPVREVVPRADQAVVVPDQLIQAVEGVDAWSVLRRQNVPEDVRIMQTIVSTALQQVERPELPKALAGDSTADSTGLRSRAARDIYVLSGQRGFSVFGNGDVSGFYMAGYGYLFTVRWPVASGMGLYNAQLAELAAHGQQAVVDEDQDRAKAVSAWAAQYRQRLSDALRDVIAGYGSTLHRAKPGEAITFLADFGGGDSATVTMSVKANALHGTDVEANRGAIQVSRGQSGMSERLHTQLMIMSQIIDTSLRSESSGNVGSVVLRGWAASYLGRSDPQFVPGYGAIFRTTARLSTVRTFASLPGSRRDAADSLEAKARKTYQAHLDTLRSKSVEILATYGPTLTGLKDDDWVGIYYDVGSAAGLLNGGMDDYLVQARMRDIRQAATQANPAGWLAGHLVTNEKQE
jgi:hypothetical protein